LRFARYAHAPCEFRCLLPAPYPRAFYATGGICISRNSFPDRTNHVFAMP
jgi:hypothetical protein